MEGIQGILATTDKGGERIMLKQTPEQISDDMAQDYLRPFDAFGKHWQGDIFYSWIHDRTKKMPDNAFQRVANLLRDKGYYIHS